MRLSKVVVYALASLAVMSAGTAQSEPIKIRNAFVVPVANWAPMLEARRTSPSIGASPT